MKKLVFFLWTLALSVGAQNVAVWTHQAANTKAYADGCPGDWPYVVQDLGPGSIPADLLARGWKQMTKAELAASKAALEPVKEAWNLARGTVEVRKQQVGDVLQQRLASGQWEPNLIRLHALESEMFGSLTKAFRLNCELLLLVTKAVAGTAATNNLSAPERARVAGLRPQLSFPQASDITQADRDRFAAIVAELQKVEALWVQARNLRTNIDTNVVLVDPESLPKVSIGE